MRAIGIDVENGPSVVPTTGRDGRRNTLVRCVLGKGFASATGATILGQNRKSEVAMRTHDEGEKTARVLGDERWDISMQCGVHNWQALPRTESGEHYCPNCCTIWTADGA